MRPTGGSTVSKERDDSLIESDLYGLLVTTAAEALNPGVRYLTPGATAYFDTPINTGRDVDAKPDRIATAAYYLLKDGLEPLINKVLGGTQMSATTFGKLNVLVGCVTNALGLIGGSGIDVALAVPGTGAGCVNVSDLVASMRSDLSASLRAGVKGIDHRQAFNTLKKVDLESGLPVAPKPRHAEIFRPPPAPASRWVPSVLRSGATPAHSALPE